MIDADRLEDAGQGHLLAALDRLTGQARENLASQIADLDLDHVQRLIAAMNHAETPVDTSSLEPPAVIELPTTAGDNERDQRAAEVGERHLRAGRVAAVLLAGGQGSRLGYDGPKGEFPFTASGTTLFEHHAARITALRHRYGCELPWYVMTSPQNDSQTRAFFESHNWFGMDSESIHLFVQGTLPAVDRESGRILREAPDRLALAPDGHGGIFPALLKSGALDDMSARGVSTFVTYQVDNPLLRVADPAFLGHHIEGNADMSSIVVRKRDAGERVGIVASSHGRTLLVEYSDLPDDLANATEPDGTLRYWAGSIAAHAIECDFARSITDGLPYHRAIKRVPFVDDLDQPVDPAEPNAVKFEAFMFDALPRARHTVTVEARRDDQFSPIKNADGNDSPATARTDCHRLYARWLAAAGVDVPLTADGSPAVAIEIDPRFALDEAELCSRVDEGLQVDAGEDIVLRG